MFDKSVYVTRRKQLINKMSGGLVLILGTKKFANIRLTRINSVIR